MEVDQAVAEVETAKSVVEVPSSFAGSVTTLHGTEGDACRCCTMPRAAPHGSFRRSSGSWPTGPGMDTLGRAGSPAAPSPSAVAAGFLPFVANAKENLAGVLAPL